MITLLLIVAIALGQLLFAALFLWLAARWVKAAKAHYPRALASILATSGVGLLALAASMWIEEVFGQERAGLLVTGNVALLVGQVVVSCLIVATLMQTPFLRAFVAWLASSVLGSA